MENKSKYLIINNRIVQNTGQSITEDTIQDENELVDFCNELLQEKESVQDRLDSLISEKEGLVTLMEEIMSLSNKLNNKIKEI